VNEAEVGKKLQGRVDRPRTWGILAVGAFLHCLDHLVSVPGTAAEHIEQDEAQRAPLHPAVSPAGVSPTSRAGAATTTRVARMPAVLPVVGMFSVALLVMAVMSAMPTSAPRFPISHRRHPYVSNYIMIYRYRSILHRYPVSVKRISVSMMPAEARG